MQGYRKWTLGMVFVVGGFALLGGALFMDKPSDVIAALAAAFVSLATGLGVIVYGNIKEHQAKGGRE